VKIVRRRNRVRPALSLVQRLEQAAQAARAAAEVAQTETERQTLLKAARRYQTAARLDEWLASPGLRPPT
jgi:hypothetical protein